MIQVTELSEKDLREIGLAYANYVYPEHDKGMFPFDDKEMLTNYIVGFAKSCMQAGMLYATSERHEGYATITTPDTKYPLKSVVTFIREVIGALGWKRYLWFVKYIAKGGESLEAKMRKQKRKYIVVQLLAIPEQYQHQGYMRQMMEFALKTAQEYKLPLVIETDEKVKCDKYCHLGVALVHKREFGDNRYGYGMMCENRSTPL